jgi:hypothetical protein
MDLVLRKRPVPPRVEVERIRKRIEVMGFGKLTIIELHPKPGTPGAFSFLR